MPDGTAAAFSPETIAVTDRTVACDGGGGALGHPRVFLRIVDRDVGGIVDRDVVCPYCSRRFVLKEGAGHDGGH